MDTALTLTTDMKLVLGLVGFTMAMFLFERIRADVVALVVLLLLGLSGLVAPSQVFNGFSSNAVMAVIATMILGAGLGLDYALFFDHAGDDRLNDDAGGAGVEVLCPGRCRREQQCRQCAQHEAFAGCAVDHRGSQ